MKKVNLSLTISLIIIAFITGLVSGYFVTPNYQQTMFEKEEMGLGAADRFVDLRYINQMAAHHKGAILLAEQVEDKTQRSEIKSLALDIKKGEPKLIEELYSWKKEWYNDERKAKDPTVASIGEADEKTDLRFLNALIAHHEAGIKMTQEIRTKSSRSEVLNNADDVENFLQDSLVTLRGFRVSWYGVK